MKRLLILLLLTAPLFAQTSGNVTMLLFPGAPTGPCNPRQLAMNLSTGQMYSCNNNVWQIMGGGGGGSTLNGCQTATAGNLTCSNSMSVTASGVGYVQLGSGTLPAPPTTAAGTLSSGPSGAPYWSPGNNTAFIPLASQSDLASATNGMLTVASFTPCNMMGWTTAGSQSCADLASNVQWNSAYTISAVDLNRVVENHMQGAVTNTLPLPIGALAAPFSFWVDTMCVSNLTLSAAAGAFINGRANWVIGACGWAHVWADSNGADWHAQIYSPPGGVTVIQ